MGTTAGNDTAYLGLRGGNNLDLVVAVGLIGIMRFLMVVDDVLDLLEHLGADRGHILDVIRHADLDHRVGRDGVDDLTQAIHGCEDGRSRDRGDKRGLKRRKRLGRIGRLAEMRGVLHIPLEHKRVGRAIIAGKDNVAEGIGRVVKHIAGRWHRHDRHARPDAIQARGKELSERLAVLIDPVNAQHDARLRSAIAWRDFDPRVRLILGHDRVRLVHRIGKVELIAHGVRIIALTQIPAQEQGVIRGGGNLNRLAGIAIAVLSSDAQVRIILRRIGRLRVIDVDRVVLELKTRLQGQIPIRRKRANRFLGDVLAGLGVIPALKGKVVVEHPQSTSIERDLGARIDRRRAGNIGQLNAVHQFAFAFIDRLGIGDLERRRLRILKL